MLISLRKAILFDNDSTGLAEVGVAQQVEVHPRCETFGGNLCGACCRNVARVYHLPSGIVELPLAILTDVFGSECDVFTLTIHIFGNQDVVAQFFLSYDARYHILFAGYHSFDRLAVCALGRGDGQRDVIALVGRNTHGGVAHGGI